MRILFDSKQPQFKTPFGTLRTGEDCVLTIWIPAAIATTAVTMILEDCEGRQCAAFPFIRREKTHFADSDGYEFWECHFAQEERGLYYYWFRVEKKDGSFRLFKQGNGTNMEAGEKWQISVIPTDFKVPDYARGAVMYQILPDRFAKSGNCDLTEKLQPFTLHADCSDTPEFRPDAHGEVLNNDFFGGNFAGIREKLPYLHSLGVGMIYLNPIFMAYSNHRYDTADYKRPDPMLGTEEDFRDLCEEAHRLGIRVILDGVFSHTGSNSVYFDAKHVFGNGAVSNPDSPYREWYRFQRYPEAYESWWGIHTLPCVEELTESYVNYIIEDEDSVVAHWMKLGADGFRLDVVDELPDAFVLKLKRRIRELNPEAFLLGEVWEDASNKQAYGVSRRYFVDGELDSVMNYPWRSAIIDFVSGVDDGTALGERIMTIAENYPPQVLDCVMNHLGTHDTPRILTVLGDPFYGSKEEKAERYLSPEARRLAVERLQAAAFLQFTLPGMPSIYYGDEAGAEGFEDPFCRRFYPWGREDVSLLEYFKELASLRNRSAALKHGNVRVIAAGSGKIEFIRESTSQSARVRINLSEEEWVLEKGTGKTCFGKRLGFFNGHDCTILSGGFCVQIWNN